MLPESSPQSDWLRRELDSRFLASQDRGGPRGLPSPFMVQPSVQPQLGPPGSLMRPVMPPPPGASFLARSLVQGLILPNFVSTCFLIFDDVIKHLFKTRNYFTFWPKSTLVVPGILL